MIFDSYNTYRVGAVTANLMVAKNALEQAAADLDILTDYDRKHPLNVKVREALAAATAARVNPDALWDLARPPR